ILLNFFMMMKSVVLKIELLWSKKVTNHSIKAGNSVQGSPPMLLKPVFSSAFLVGKHQFKHSSCSTSGPEVVGDCQIDLPFQVLSESFEECTKIIISSYL